MPKIEKGTEIEVPKLSDSLYVVMPAYNEADNIGRVLAEWYPIVERLGEPSRLVVMDDGSTDGTLGIVERFASAHPLVKPLAHPNAGHGPTVLELYDYAIGQGAEWVFQTDSDGQTSPAQFSDFWRDRAEYDALIGWRRDRRDGLPRVAVSRALRIAVHLTFGVRVADANSPFRLMSAESLKRLLPLVPDGFSLPNAAICALYSKLGMRTGFREVDFAERQAGVNSLNFRKAVIMGLGALRDFRAISVSAELLGRGASQPDCQLTFE